MVKLFYNYGEIMAKHIYFLILLVLLISCATELPSPEIFTLYSGLKYRDLVLGSGKACKIGDNIKINYLVKNTDSTEIENTWTSGRPMTFKIGNGETIRGIDEGVLNMKKGAKRELWIPQELGFYDEHSLRTDTGMLYILVEFIEYSK